MLKMNSEKHFFSNGQRITIKAVYSWYNVYINNRMILKNISREDAASLINTIIKANETEV